MGADKAKEMLDKLNQPNDAGDPDPNNPNQDGTKDPTVDELKSMLAEKESENQKLQETNATTIANLKAMQKNLSSRDSKANQTNARLDGIEDLIVGLAEQQSMLGQVGRPELIGESDFGITPRTQQPVPNVVADTVAKMREARKQEQEQQSQGQTVDDFKLQMWNRLSDAGINPNEKEIVDAIGPLMTKGDFEGVRDFVNRTVIMKEVEQRVEARANEVGEEKAREVLQKKGYIVNENPQGPSAPAGQALKRGDLRSIVGEAKTPWDIINATKDKSWEIQ